jgi:hypothetical protein
MRPDEEARLFDCLLEDRNVDDAFEIAAAGARVPRPGGDVRTQPTGNLGMSRFDQEVVAFLSKPENITPTREIEDLVGRLKREMIVKFWKTLPVIVGARLPTWHTWHQGLPLDSYTTVWVGPLEQTNTSQHLRYAVQQEVRDLLRLRIGIVWQDGRLPEPVAATRELERLRLKASAAGFDRQHRWWPAYKFLVKSLYDEQTTRRLAKGEELQEEVAGELERLISETADELAAVNAKILGSS